MTSNLNIVNDTIRCFIRSTNSDVQISTVSPLHISGSTITCTSDRGGNIDEDLVWYIKDLNSRLQELTSTVTNLQTELSNLTAFKTELTQVPNP